MRLQCNFLPQNDGQCGWYETLPPPGPSHPLKGAVSADWVVLGAGLAGLAAARRLAELLPQASIALIDAKRAGFGAAGRNSGFMVDLPHDLTSHSYTSDKTADQRIIRLSRGGIDFMREIVQREGIECDWREQGKLHGAVNAQGANALASFAKGLSELGEPYTMLDAVRMKAITGTDFYKSGLHAPGCVLVQPAALCRGLARSLPANVTLYEDSPVLNIDIGKPHTLSTADGSISAPRMIMANNAYAAPFAELGLRGRLLPVYTYASLTRELTPEEQARLGGDESWALIPADPLGTTVRRVASGRICIRNSFTYNPRLTATAATLERVRRAHRLSFEARFPMLPGVPFEYTWGGALCISRNSGSVFGEIAPAVYSAVCCNGLGLTRSTVAGKLIAEYALGMNSELLDIMLEQPAPSRNPPEPFLGMGLRSSIAWKEWTAGAEL